mgnify:CR=1 FL=1
MSRCGFTARHHRGSAVVAERSADIHDRGNVAKKMLQLVITDEVAQSSNAWCVKNRGGNPLISLSYQQTVCIMYSEGNRKAICSKDSSLWACTHWSKPCCILPMQSDTLAGSINKKKKTTFRLSSLVRCVGDSNVEQQSCSLSPTR